MSSDARLRIRCRVTTALCCTLAPLLAMASPAHAADECGLIPPGGGIIECPAADYPDGISYDAGVEDLTVVVDPGSALDGGLALQGGSLSAILNGVSVSTTSNGEDAVSLASSTGGDLIIAVQDLTTVGDLADGIYANTGTGGISITNGIKGSNGLITTSGIQSDGIHAEAGGDIGIASDTIRTYGSGADGIEATSTDGGVSISSTQISTADGGRGITADAAQDLTIVSGSISTVGKYGTGINAISQLGNVTIDGGGDVSTNGDNAFGIVARADQGSVTIDAGSVSTNGFYSRGIQASGTGDIGITVDSVSTHSPSFAADGIFAVGGGAITIDAGSIDVYGSHSYGINAIAPGAITINAQSVTTGHNQYGGYSSPSPGIAAISANGDVSIDAGSVDTQGFGIAAIENYYGLGGVSVTAGDILTHGDHAFGIYAVDRGYGDITINANTVNADGVYSFGILADGSGTNRVDFGQVHVAGDGSFGIYSRTSAGKDVSITGDAISTRGNSAFGVAARSDGGNVSIDVANTTTNGLGAYAVVGVAVHYTDENGDIHYGNIDINADDVRTYGGISTGIFAASNAGDIEVSAGHVETHSYGSPGIRILSSTAGYQGGVIVDRATNILLNADEVATYGDNSDAVSIYSSYGTIEADLRSVETHGTYSAGVFIDSPFLLDGIPKPVDIALNVDTVETTGDAGIGILVLAGTGSVDVDAETVTSSGHNGSGIVVLGRNGADLSINADAVELHDPGGAYAAFSPGLYAVSSGGNVTVTAGHVSTEGTYSGGVIAASNGQTDYYGGTHVGDVHVDAGSVSTQGNSSIGVAATSAGGSVDVHAGSVTTSGDDSIGVAANSFAFVPGYAAAEHSLYAGDLTLIADDVSTSGDHSGGVSALGFGGGNTNVTVGTVETSGNYSDGVNVVTSGALNYYTGQLYTGDLTKVTVDSATTTGDNSNGVRVFAFSGDVDVTVGSVVTSGKNSDGVLALNGSDGSVTVDVLDKVNSAQGYGVVAAAYDGVAVNIAEGATVFGGKVGVYVSAYYDGAVATVTNHGEISSDGFAVVGAYQSVVIDNPGTIVGPVALSDSADSFDNSGTWVAFGRSDFRGGEDILTNSGRVMADAGAPTGTVTIGGLETFDNSGLVSLVDGRAGQTLFLNGTSFNGSGDSTLDISGSAFALGTGGSTLALDVGSNAGGSLIADKLKFGAASGTTNLTLSGTPALGAAVVVDAQSATGANNFVLPGGTQDLGFVRFNLDFDAGASDWTLVGTPDNEIFETVRIAGGAQSLWQHGADSWTEMMRDQRGAERDGIRLWARYLGGHETVGSRGGFTVLGSRFEPDLSTESHWDGAQLGADFTRGAWTWGVMGGSAHEDVRFRSDDNKLRFHGPSFGGYASLRSGKLYVDVLAQYQSIRGSANLATAAISEDLRGHVFGFHGDAGMTVPLGGVLAQPEVGLSWSQGRLDDVNGGGADMNFNKFTGLQGRAGARFSGLIRSGAVAIQPYVGLYAVEDMSGDNAIEFRFGGQTLRLRDRTRPGYAEGNAGVIVDVGHGFRLSAGGRSDFLGGHHAWKGQLGLSWHG